MRTTLINELGVGTHSLRMKHEFNLATLSQAPLYVGTTVKLFNELARMGQGRLQIKWTQLGGVALSAMETGDPVVCRRLVVNQTDSRP